jgi:hypothetical protein
MIVARGMKMLRFERTDVFNAMRNALGGKRVIPAPLAPFRDAPDDCDMEVGQLPLPGAVTSWVIHIRYVNAAGEESERSVTCKRLTSHIGGSLTLSGYCHLRELPRTFSVAKMVEVMDATTGEFVDPAEYFEELRLEGLPFVNRGMETFARMCTFMSRCDGHEHPAEWAEIEHGLERYALRFAGDEHDISQSLSSCRSLAPDDRDFVRSVAAVKRSPDGRGIARLAIDTCSRIVDADNYHANEEITWGSHIGNVLKVIATGGS